MKPLLVVEDDLSKVSAQAIVKESYDVITYVDATPAVLKDRSVLLWPTAGHAGTAKRSRGYARYAQEVKVLSTHGMTTGWNAFKACEENWDLIKLVEWGKPRVMVVPREVLPPMVPDQAPAVLVEKYGLACRKSGEPYCNAA